MTQEYTPVAWQDETTSQQGTLINAERLNQMQTAHHFADGLEEVDAIPTADPGVSYHKIVYCTADSTIYRWDGTEWTKDIDDETKALLQQEIARATEAEGELAQSIEDETTARETADTAMQADISDLGDAIEAEETARGQADTALGTRITNETSARETADTALGNRITAEATARADADTALGGRIDTEQARAEAAEQANAQAIANTYTKAEIDTLLGVKADVATTYTKTETDTLLGTKADQATTYTKAEVQTYVSDALDGYLPMVRTTGNQDITGTKNNMSMGVANLAIGGSTARWIRLAYTTISDGALSGYILPDKDTGKNASMYFSLLGRRNAGVFKARNLLGSLNTALYALTYDGTNYELWYHYPENTTNWRVTVCIRGGNAGRDFILDGTTTKASLDAADYTWLINPTLESDDLVHRSGAEVITGSKTFYDASLGYINISGGRTSGPMGVLRFRNYQDVLVSGLYAEVDGTTVIDLLGTTKAFKVHNQRAYSAGNTTDVATIGTLDAYAPMVRTTGNQTIGGYKKFEYKPNIASYYVVNANLVTKWVRVCSYASLPNYNDMHCITRFISGHTTDTDFMFDVDIKQRSPAYTGNSALFLVNNASVRPLAINRAPTGTEVGLVAVFRTVDNTERVEIWGKFAGNRLIVTVQNYNIINALPTADGVYKNEFSHDNDGSFITWDLNTYADEPPEGTSTQYLKKGNEAS